MVTYKPFVGTSDPSFLSRQLEHVISLGGEKQVCFGADFFDLFDLPLVARQRRADFFQGVDRPAVVAQLEVTQTNIIVGLIHMRTDRELLDHVPHDFE